VTNEILDEPLANTFESNFLKNEACTFCEIVMQYIEKAIGKKNSREHIENVIHSMCNHLPKSFAKDCNNFVDEYGDVLITILADEISPKEICSILGLCKVSLKQVEGTLFGKKT
jgi:saposin